MPITPPRLLYDFLMARSDARGAARAMVAYARRLRCDGAPGQATVAEALAAYGVCAKNTLLMSMLQMRTRACVRGRRRCTQKASSWCVRASEAARAQPTHRVPAACAPTHPTRGLPPLCTRVRAELAINALAQLDEPSAWLDLLTDPWLAAHALPDAPPPPFPLGLTTTSTADAEEAGAEGRAGTGGAAVAARVASLCLTLQDLTAEYALMRGAAAVAASGTSPGACAPCALLLLL